MQQTKAYSLGVKIAFWCLWSLCAVFLLPFAYSIIYMISISIPPYEACGNIHHKLANGELVFIGDIGRKHYSVPIDQPIFAQS